MSAPAGFGKTTLLAEWIARSAHDGHHIAWLSLDASDNDISVFWSYAIAAVQTAAPDAGEEAMALLRGSQPLPSVMSSLLNDLAGLDSELVLVLDDYHVIDAAEVHEAVAFVVDHAPAQLHLVIASRSDPPLPLARLRARGDLLEIPTAAGVECSPGVVAAAGGVSGAMAASRSNDDSIPATLPAASTTTRWWMPWVRIVRAASTIDVLGETVSTSVDIVSARSVGSSSTASRSVAVMMPTSRECSSTTASPCTDRSRSVWRASSAVAVLASVHARSDTIDDTVRIRPSSSSRPRVARAEGPASTKAGTRRALDRHERPEDGLDPAGPP